MKNRYFYIIITLFTLLSARAFPQIDCITDPPLPPVLTSVSVQPETGNTILTWSLSPSPNIAAYILYSYKNGDGMPIDTVRDPAATTYTLSNTASKYFSVSYVVAAMRLPRCTSIFSNVINSIFEDVSIDTCMKKIKVSWNNYQSIPPIPLLKVTGYSVLLSVDGGNYTETGNVSAGETSFTLNDYTIDAESELTHFSLERKTGATGTFQEIARLVSVNGSVHYTDIQAETNIINYYRLSAVNSCSLPVMASNISSNIVLSLNRSGDNLILSWNPYKNWLGIISSYKLFVNTGKGFEELAVIPASDTTFIQGYQQIMYEVSGTEVCFYLSASETSNPYNVTGESISSKICTSPTEIITVPNVFTPNNDRENDLFRPVLSFTPLEYHLIISDRQGKVLFETRDYLAAWDGSQSGNPQPQGVCLWFLKLTTPSGKIISRTGTITIINNK